MILTEKENLHAKLYEKVSICKKCIQLKDRLNPVFYRGSIDAPIFLIGEAPGENEDKLGLPFIGKTGKFQDKLLIKAGMDIECDIYIVNTLKCRPPHNRNPLEEEIKNCENFLLRQMEVVNPKIIITSGKISRAWMIIKIREGLFKIAKTEGFNKSGMDNFYYLEDGRVWLPVYHPRYLMTNKEESYKAYKAFQKVVNMI